MGSIHQFAEASSGAAQDAEIAAPRWVLMRDSSRYSPQEWVDAYFGDGGHLKGDQAGQRYTWMKSRFDTWKTFGDVRDGVLNLEVAMKHVVDLANDGDPSARRACLEAASEFLSAGAPLPKQLSVFLAAFCAHSASVHSPSKPANRPREFHNEDRDQAIAFAVDVLFDYFGMRIYGERVAGRDSACSLVQTTLERLGIAFTVDAIEHFYKKSYPRAKMTAEEVGRHLRECGVDGLTQEQLSEMAASMNGERRKPSFYKGPKVSPAPVRAIGS